jgi:hypothetical protein
MNELTNCNMLSSSVQAMVSDKSLVDRLKGTVVWEYDSMACPQMIVQLYKMLMKIYTNQMNIYKGSTAVVEHKDKAKQLYWKSPHPSYSGGIMLTRLISRASPYLSTMMIEWRWHEANLLTRAVIST